MLKLPFRVIGSLFLVMNLTACGLVDSYYLPPSEDTASEIFEAANSAMQEKKYYHAEQLYMKLQADYPFSPYAFEAELNLGDSLFLQEKYLEAADAYKAFEELHPRNDAIPYVLYQIGMSLKNTNNSVDRTATDAAEAIRYFTRLISTYPSSIYAQQAPAEITACKTILAEREIYIADVFWNMGNSGAAYKRYMHVYENFPELTEIHEYSEIQAKAAFLKYTEDLSEEERRAIHGSWHDYFKWL